MKQRSFFIIAGVIAVLLGGLIAYKIYNKPHRDIAAERADYTVTADALFDEFEQDEPAANAKYLDNVVEVSGILEEIGFNTDDIPVYTLKAENAMIGGISATLESTEEHNANLQPGDEVIVKCRCTGKLMDVVLVNCSVLNQGS